MGKWEFYDNDEEAELSEDAEPSFSFYDFKKWLSGEKVKPESLRETTANSVTPTSKEELKKLFKKRVRDKVQKKIDDKLAERKDKK
jgi:hypothetical protein